MKSSIRHIFSLLVLTCMAVPAGCGGGGGSQPTPTHFSVSAQGNVIATTTFNFTVTALDAANNVVTTYTRTVHFTSTDAQAILPADSRMINGVGNFSVTFKSLGGQTITAIDTVTASIAGTSNSISVSGPAASFTFNVPSSVTTGTAFNFTVTATDTMGNVVVGYSGTVHITSSDALAVLPSDSKLTDGVGNLSATLKTAGGQTLTATGTVNASITGKSGTITVTGPATETGTFTIVQTGHCTFGSGTTCTISVGTAPAAGNLDVFVMLPSYAAYIPSGRTTTDSTFNSQIQSVSLGGTLQQAPGCLGRYLNNSPGCAYILPLTSTGGSTSITVTMAQATNGGTGFFVELHPSANPQFVALRDQGMQFLETAASAQGPTFADIQSGDAYVAFWSAYASNVNVTTVSAPYSSNEYLPGSNNAAYAVAVTSMPPTWTFPSTSSVVGGLTFGWNVTPCKNYFANTFSGGAIGAIPAQADLTSTQLGWQGGQWSNIVHAAPSLIYETVPTPLPPVYDIGRACGDGNSYPAATLPTQSLALVGPHPTGGVYVAYTWDSAGGSSSPPVISAGFWYYTNAPASDSSRDDCMSIHGDYFDYAAANCYGLSGQQTIGLETNEGNGSGSRYVYTSGTWVFIQLTFAHSGNHMLQVWDSTNSYSAPVYTTTHASGGMDYAAGVFIGQQAETSTISAGQTYYYYYPVISLSGQQLMPPYCNAADLVATADAASVQSCVTSATP